MDIPVIAEHLYSSLVSLYYLSLAQLSLASGSI
jgi:hypothetical protein